MNSEKSTVTICTGTTCYILGGSRYLMLAGALSPEVQARIRIKGVPCMGHCGEELGRNKVPCLEIDGRLYHGLSLEEAVELITEAVDAAVPVCS